MAHEIFISYAAEDKPTADAVCAAIEGHGIKCWYAPRDVEYGKDFEESIVDAIVASRLMILILTSHANNSAHVKREIQNACMEEVAVPVLPFRTEDIPLNKSLRYYIGSVHWLDALTPPLEPHLQRLVEHVKARAGKSPTESNPQPEPESETDRLSSGVSIDESEQPESPVPEIIADSTLEEEPPPFPDAELEAEVSPPATRGPNLRTFVIGSGILLLVVSVLILLSLVISSLLPSRSPQSGNQPANPSANSAAANDPGSLAGLDVTVVYGVQRKNEAGRIAERLRRYGARVVFSERSYNTHAGEILYYEGRVEDAKRIAAAVSDIESFSPATGSGSYKGSQFFLWMKTDR